MFALPGIDEGQGGGTRFQFGLLAGLLILAGLIASGCLGSKPPPAPPPEERYGHRYEDEGPEGRRTFTITPPEPNTTYFYYPLAFDSVHVRPAPFDPARPAEGQRVPVELLITGSLPNSCSVVHDVEQERAGHIINVDMQLRRPQGVLCTSIEAPYRFYVMLEGRYGVGNYTLKINDRAYAFVIKVPEQ